MFLDMTVERGWRQEGARRAAHDLQRGMASSGCRACLSQRYALVWGPRKLAWCSAPLGNRSHHPMKSTQAARTADTARTPLLATGLPREVAFISPCDGVYKILSERVEFL